MTVFKEPNPMGDDDDWAMLHYAVGILMGLGHKYGALDVTIYHNDIRVRIEPGQNKEKRDGESE